jgi:hypothetical protein
VNGSISQAMLRDAIAKLAIVNRMVQTSSVILNDATLIFKGSIAMPKDLKTICKRINGIFSDITTLL